MNVLKITACILYVSSLVNLIIASTWLMVPSASPAGIILNDDPYLGMARAEEGPYALSLHCNNKLIVVFINRETEDAEVPAKGKSFGYFTQDNKWKEYRNFSTEMEKITYVRTGGICHNQCLPVTGQTKQEIPIFPAKSFVSAWKVVSIIGIFFFTSSHVCR